MPRREGFTVLEEVSLPQIIIRPVPSGGELQRLRDDARSNDCLDHQFAGLPSVRVVGRVSNQIKTDCASRNNVSRSEKADPVAGGLKVAVTADPRGRMPVGNDEASGRGGQRHEPFRIVLFEPERRGPDRLLIAHEGFHKPLIGWR